MDGLEVTLNQLKQKIDRIADAVLGDPSDQQKPGHSIRLDRLEQTNKRQGKVMLALGGGFVSVLATIVAAVLIKVF